LRHRRGSSDVDTSRNVYQLISAVSAELAKAGISKSRNNTQQNYRFRGIDDVYNALAPVLATHGLVILPRILSRQCVERTTAKGGVLFYVTVEAEFDFISAHDGSHHTVRTFGEAMDSADKATNKAMSAAYKYAAFQTFCIPTEGDNDADATTHDIAPTVPEGYENWALDLETLSIEEARAAFKESKPEFRDYFTKHDKARYEKFKAASAKAKAA
jgi:hypothetical protein